VGHAVHAQRNKKSLADLETNRKTYERLLEITLIEIDGDIGFDFFLFTFFSPFDQAEWGRVVVAVHQYSICY
jgi:hypothetical protein